MFNVNCFDLLVANKMNTVRLPHIFITSTVICRRNFRKRMMRTFRQIISQ